MQGQLVPSVVRASGGPADGRPATHGVPGCSRSLCRLRPWRPAGVPAAVQGQPAVCQGLGDDPLPALVGGVLGGGKGLRRPHQPVECCRPGCSGSIRKRTKRVFAAAVRSSSSVGCRSPGRPSISLLAALGFAPAELAQQGGDFLRGLDDRRDGGVVLAPDAQPDGGLFPHAGDPAELGGHGEQRAGIPVEVADGDREFATRPVPVVGEQHQAPAQRLVEAGGEQRPYDLVGGSEDLHHGWPGRVRRGRAGGAHQMPPGTVWTISDWSRLVQASQ
jgi:hypothetical protein